MCFLCIYKGKQFESEIYNKMWCLNVAPNGASKKWRDYFDVFLVLCGLPEGVRSIDTVWMVKCAKLNINTRRRYHFDYDKRNCNDCWTSDDSFKQLSFEDFREFDEIELVLHIEIKGVKGNYSNDIPEKEWDRYLDPKLRKLSGHKYSQIQPIPRIPSVDDEQLNQVMFNMGVDAYGISGNWSI